jgi:hypothetical protein
MGLPCHLPDTAAIRRAEIVCREGSLQMVMHFRRYPWGEAMRRSHKVLSRVGGSKWRHVTQAMPSYATTQDGPHIRPVF